MPTLFSIIESPTFPNFGAFFKELGIEETRITSMRKALSLLKKQQPDYIVCEFFYGYGNNYAGVNVCNLDVMLYSLQKYSPDTRVVVLVDKSEREYVDKLIELFPLHAVLVYPITPQDMKVALSA
jgi:DNA-binding NarL/FixJ family response regulator